LPTIEARKYRSPLEKFALYDFVESRVEDWIPSDRKRYADEYEEAYAYENGKRWPIYITGEDTLSLKVLLDYDSPEWQWLRATYAQLNQAITRDGATPVILIIPLAYQLEEDYPYLPQQLVLRYCQENSLHCLDLLPLFRKHNQEMLYMGTSSGYNDVWHLTERGHQLAAGALKTYLIEQELLFIK
jgi:hypothetical protein